MNQTLEKIAKSIFKQWLIHFEFSNKHKRPYKSNSGEMTDSELGKIPKNWEVGTLSDLCDSMQTRGQQRHYHQRLVM